MNHEKTHELPGKDSLLPAYPLMKAIEQMGKHISSIIDEEYATIPSDLFTSTPGAQVRHTLDHVRALIEGFHSGVMDYDIRERGGPIESSRTAALNRIHDHYEQLKQIGSEDMLRPVVARLLLDPDGEILEHPSSLSREIAFVLSHTIHHNAILLSMFRHLGKEADSKFGYAPATLAYRESIASAL